MPTNSAIYCYAFFPGFTSKIRVTLAVRQYLLAFIKVYPGGPEAITRLEGAQVEILWKLQTPQTV